MPARLVPTTRTTYNPTQMTEGLVKAWVTTFKVLPKKESIGVLWSQNYHETGGTKSMWNNNVGNTKYKASGSDDTGIDYMMLSNVWEMVNGVKTTYQPPHPATWFRSFPTLADGLAHHLDFLRNKRYKSSWGAIEAGSPSQFAHLLKVAGYYTDSEENYSKALNGYFNKFMKDTTYENVVESIKPKLNIDESTGEVTVTGNLDLDTTDTTSTIGIITGALSGLFGNKG